MNSTAASATLVPDTCLPWFNADTFCTGHSSQWEMKATTNQTPSVSYKGAVISAATFSEISNTALKGSEKGCNIFISSPPPIHQGFFLNNLDSSKFLNVFCIFTSFSTCVTILFLHVQFAAQLDWSHAVFVKDVSHLTYCWRDLAMLHPCGAMAQGSTK